MKTKFTAVFAFALSFVATAFAQYSLSADDAKSAAKSDAAEAVSL